MILSSRPVSSIPYRLRYVAEFSSDRSAGTAEACAVLVLHFPRLSAQRGLIRGYRLVTLCYILKLSETSFCHASFSGNPLFNNLFFNEF